MKHLRVRIIHSALDDKPIPFKSDDEDLKKFDSLRTDIAIENLIVQVPVKTVADVDEGLTIMRKAREHPDVIYFENAEYKALMAKMEEFGPLMYRYNYRQVEEAMKDLIEDEEESEPDPEENHATDKLPAIRFSLPEVETQR